MLSVEEIQAIRERFVECRSGPYICISAQSFIEDVPALLAEVDRLGTDAYGAWCWLSEALGPECGEFTSEGLRLSAEALSKRITALADHLEGKPSDIDLGMYDSAGGSFGRLLAAAKRLQLEERERCARVADEEVRKSLRDRDICVKAIEAEWAKPEAERDRHHIDSCTADASSYTADAITFQRIAAAIRSRSGGRRHFSLSQDEPVEARFVNR